MTAEGREVRAAALGFRVREEKGVLRMSSECDDCGIEDGLDF